MELTRIAYLNATALLTEDGLTWDSPVADISDTLVMAGFPLVLIEAAIEAWA